MKDLLHEFCRESVVLMQKHGHASPAANLKRGLLSLTHAPYNHQSSIRYAAAALREVSTSTDHQRFEPSILSDTLPNGFAHVVTTILDYIQEHLNANTTPNRAETEFAFSIICLVCTYVTRIKENYTQHGQLYTGEESWRARSWVRHSITATIEDKIRSLQPRRNATQAELFADMGATIEQELPPDRETRNYEALHKIRAVMSGSAQSIEHISNYQIRFKNNRSSDDKDDDDDESSYRAMGMSAPFDKIVADLQEFIRQQNLYEKEYDEKHAGRRSISELRGSAYRSELLYSIGCAICAFMMAVFMEHYRRPHS